MKVKSRAPLRLGLAGGGTDISPFCDDNVGFVLNATINKYVYCVIEPNRSGVIEFVEADTKKSAIFESEKKLEKINENFLLQIGTYNSIIRNFLDKPLSFKMITFSDAGPGSGLGGSSTFVVAMLKAYSEWLHLPLGDYDLAQLAYEIERKDLGLIGGKQDQYAATFGGFNFMEFHAEKVIVNPLRIKPHIVNELETLFLLYDTKSPRRSGNIIKEQMERARSDTNSIESLFELKADALMMKEAVLLGNFTKIASIINKGWKSKKMTASTVSNERIDSIMEEAKSAGALAGRVSGAGGGGYMLFIVGLEKRIEVINTLSQFGGLSSRINFSKKGVEAWVY